MPSGEWELITPGRSHSVLLLQREDRANYLDRAWLRVAVVAVWLLVLLGVGYGAGDPGFRAMVPFAAAHLLMGILLLPRAVHDRELVYLWALAWLDAPMNFLALSAGVRASGDPLPLALMGCPTFLIMVLFSFSTWRIRQTVVVAVETAVLGMALVWLAGGRLSGWLALPPATALVGLLAARTLGWRLRRLADEWIGAGERLARLRRYFSPQVAERITGLPQHEKREVTVLFADLRSFSAFSERSEPGEVLGTLNEYLTAMTEAVFGEGGTLDKFLGDGLLAYFGAPLPQADHAAAAVRAARAILVRVEVLNARRAGEGKATLQVGLGLHSGPALIGDVGPPNRREFTILGDTVNVASRLQSVTREHEVAILCSQETRERAGGEAWKSIGFVTLRGRSAPTQIWTPA